MAGEPTLTAVQARAAATAGMDPVVRLLQLIEQNLGGGSGLPLVAGDVEIGAVELKDAAADVRAAIKAANTAAVGDNGLVVADPNTLARMVTSDGRLAAMVTSLADLAQRGGREVLDRWTRPADVTPYTINDMLRATTNDTGTTGLRPLALARAAGKGFLLSHFSVRFKKVDFLPTIRVHMWLIPNPATLGGGAAVIPGDNAALSLIDANIPARIGAFDLPACTLAHATDDYVGAATDQYFKYHVQPTDANIYYGMEIIAGASITPSSAMQVSVLGRSVDL